MHFVSSKSLFLAVTAASITMLGGCQSSDSSAPEAMNTNSSSVRTSGTTEMKSDLGQFEAAKSFPTGEKTSSLVMVQASGPKTVLIQHEATYQIKVTNLTAMPLHNVMLVSTNPDGFKSAAVTGSTAQENNGGQATYPVGDLGPNEIKSLSIKGTATKVGTVDTCYAVQYEFAPTTLCTSLAVTNPTLMLDVQAPVDTDICKSVTYKYTVTNNGTGTAHNVTLEEPLPDGLKTTDGKSSVMANLSDIPQGESRVATAQLKAERTGTFAGQASAKSDGDSTLPFNTSTAVHAPMLAITVAGGATDYVGKTVGYQIVVTNKGDATASNAKVSIGHTGEVGTVMVTDGDSAGLVSLGDLAPNASKTIMASTTSERGGTVTITANASANCAPAVSGSGTTEFKTIAALLLETVDEVDPVKVGDSVIYDVKVTNQGSGPDTNVMVGATIPDGEQYVSTDGPTQPTLSGSSLTFPTVANLASKESVTWKVTVKAVTAGDVQFKTTAKSDGVKAGAEKTEPTKLY